MGETKPEISMISGLCDPKELGINWLMPFINQSMNQLVDERHWLTDKYYYFTD